METNFCLAVSSLLGERVSLMDKGGYWCRVIGVGA